MAEAEEEIVKWCSGGGLPESADVFAVITGSDGLFRIDEGSCWDFKESWPFSLSDDYFAAIARSICAFSNTRGGLLIFGVHDKHRLGGFNKVNINFDRFRLALRQLLGDDVPLYIKSYLDSERGKIDVLFISPRPLGVRPYKFRAKLGKYHADTIWIRSGHEVISASPVNFPTLFCRKNEIQSAGLTVELDGSLPPSPATLKRFIGRIKVMEDLFDWLQNSDEPRTYLYGKGGSGKSTIAFEFAHLLKPFGSELKLNGADNIDGVIFLSAKEKSMQTAGGLITAALEPDFHNEKELYEKILYYGRWIIDEGILVT